jgi:hypothetical protein
MIILDIIIALVTLCDLAMLVTSLTKHWRITISFLIGVSIVLILCAITDSNAFRWIIGFHLFITLITLGIIWDSKRGALRKSN